jgi:hypothetical protein
MRMDYIMHIPLKVSSATSNFMIGSGALDSRVRGKGRVQQRGHAKPAKRGKEVGERKAHDVRIKGLTAMLLGFFPRASRLRVVVGRREQPGRLGAALPLPWHR